MELHSKNVVLEHTFTDFAGDRVTCQVEYDSSIFRESTSSPYAANADTQAFDITRGVDCRAQVSVDIAYRDLAGRPQTAPAFGNDFVDLQLDEVQGNIVVTHQVFFLDCSGSDCQTSYTTSPK